MKYIKTYENILHMRNNSNIFSGFFLDKNIKKIKSAINNLLFSSDDMQQIKDFSQWLYYNNKKSAYLLIKEPGTAASIKNVYIDMTAKQWIEISIKKDSTRPELLYIKSLLIEYGSFIPATDNFYAGFDTYHLTLDNVEIFTKKINLQDFNLYQTQNKYNL